MNDLIPLVSVVIPVYRVEKYLEKGVKSITDQTYKNLQIILVDDGSDDNCPNICDKLAKNDERIISVHKKNGGLSDARNYGLKYVKGKYLYFFDSDDYLEHEAISRIVEIAEKKNADAVAFGYKMVDENDNLLWNSNMKKGAYHFNTEKEKIDFICKELCNYKVGWEAWDRLYRTDIIKKNKLVFEPNKEIFSEDRCFNIYYTLCSNNLIFLENRFYHYLIRGDSIMGNVKDGKFKETLKLMDYLYRFVRKKEFRYIARKRKYMNIALFNHALKVAERNGYEGKCSDFICNDKKKRFGFIPERLYIFIWIYGLKKGIKYFIRYEKFMLCA